jgi:hypothetical protein
MAHKVTQLIRNANNFYRVNVPDANSILLNPIADPIFFEAI